MTLALKFVLGSRVLAGTGIFLIAVVLAPLLIPWALNVLFGLGIPMNFVTWVATVILLGVLTTLFSK